MVKILSPTGLLIILQLLIDIANKIKNGNNDSGNKIRILSIFFIFKKSNRMSYLIFGTKKIFNLL